MPLMVFFAVDDQFHKHPKVERLVDDGTAGLAAIGLWTLAGSQSQAQLTTGVVRASSVARLVGSAATAKRLARLLIDAGLWEDATAADGAPAYRFHDWLDAQRRSGAAIKNERERRAQTKRPEVVDGVRARDGDHCRYCGRKVRWGVQRGDDGGTYDHVDPNADPKAVDPVTNLVVCCRKCNRLKANRSLQAAGMALRPPPGSIDGGERRNESATESGLSPDSVGSSPDSEDRASSRVRTRVARAGQGKGPGSGTGEGTGTGRVGPAGPAPPGSVVPEHLRGGIGSPWYGWRGPPPDVDQPVCEVHGLDLPCRRCNRDAYRGASP